jgi:hypothetical protein
MKDKREGRSGEVEYHEGTDSIFGYLGFYMYTFKDMKLDILLGK